MKVNKLSKIYPVSSVQKVPTSSVGFAIFLVFMNIMASSATNIYMPCIKYMASDLHTTTFMIQFSVVIHLLGELVGRIFCGPLIDQYGRRVVILPSAILSAVGHLGCYLSESIDFFIFMRIIQSFGSGVVYIVALSIISTNFSAYVKGKIISAFEMSQPVAWIISPILGGLLEPIGSWRIVFIVLFLSQLFIFAFTYFNLQEKLVKNTAHISLLKMVSSYKIVLRNAMFFVYSLVPGFTMSAYMIYASNVSFFATIFGIKETIQISLLQTFPLFFYIIATVAYRKIINNLGFKFARRVGATLYSTFVILLLLLLCDIFTFNIFVVVTIMCIQSLGSAFIIPVSVAKALQLFPHNTGICASTIAVFRSIILSCCISIAASFKGNIIMVIMCLSSTAIVVLILLILRRLLQIIRVKRYSHR